MEIKEAVEDNLMKIETIKIDKRKELLQFVVSISPFFFFFFTPCSSDILNEIQISQHTRGFLILPQRNSEKKKILEKKK